jgi:hypothetical protein
MDCQNWKFFEFKKIFDIRKGKRLTKADMVNGDIPYIGATESNNGVTARISNDEYLHSANTISVSYNGSIAEAFYQTKDFWATDDVNVLYPKFKLNKEIALFLTTIINREKYRFNYGRKWDKESMETSQIKLPAIKVANGEYEPDWIWIENYIKNDLVKKLPKRSKEVWLKIFDPKPLMCKKLMLNIKDWKWFVIKDWFDEPYKANAYNSQDLIPCLKRDTTIAHITRTDENNGCKDFVVNEGFGSIEEPNAITIGDTTATIFYQEKEFICGDHMVVLRSKHLNKYTGMFVTTLLNMERFRYNYGRAYNKGIIANTKIKLPSVKIAPNEYEPDWQFMEDYIKSLPYSSCI